MQFESTDEKKIDEEITPFIQRLDLSEKTRKRTVHILRQAHHSGISSRKAPQSILAAALYIAAILENERRTQQQISEVTGTSSTTIQLRYRELVHQLGLEST